MEIVIRANHFDASQHLQAFIEKRLSKLSLFYDGISAAEVSLKVVKPETVQNKEALVKILVPGDELYAGKVADSFEQAIDAVADALEKQLVKYKEKMRS